MFPHVSCTYGCDYGGVSQDADLLLSHLGRQPPVSDGSGHHEGSKRLCEMVIQSMDRISREDREEFLPVLRGMDMRMMRTEDRVPCWLNREAY